MRPLPSEVIAGVRQILKETIAPELTSAHARSRLEEVRAVLAQVDWDDAAFALARRNRALADALRRIEDWRSGDPRRAETIPACTVRMPKVDSLAAHQAAYAELAAAAVAVVEPMADWLVAHPSNAEARALRGELLAAL
ncbi:hypothetical protein [Georgenia ruanii]|uniref:hypothetical protein n=1 Tax=Georgenia ruanii TaxID=348442 RepID=UPI001264F902|nr:hypothetical protein [Georgenia ruanii]